MQFELMVEVNKILDASELSESERERAEAFLSRAALVALQGILGAVDFDQRPNPDHAADEALGYAWELTRQRFSL